MGVLNKLVPVRPAQLAPGERIVWQSRAGIVDRTAHAGALYVTTQRVIFLANNLNRRPVDREWSLEDIESVEIAKPDWTAYTGGFHRRLRMITTEGDVLFNLRAP